MGNDTEDTGKYTDDPGHGPSALGDGLTKDDISFTSLVTSFSGKNK